MTASSVRRTPRQGFSPQYMWDRQFSLSQFLVLRPLLTDPRTKYTTELLASRRLDLGYSPGNKNTLIDFTITSHMTGVTILFEYTKDDLYRPEQSLPSIWSAIYTIARTNNHMVPDVLRLRDTLRVRLIP